MRGIVPRGGGQGWGGGGVGDNGCSSGRQTNECIPEEGAPPAVLTGKVEAQLRGPGQRRSRTAVPDKGDPGPAAPRGGIAGAPEAVWGWEVGALRLAAVGAAARGPGARVRVRDRIWRGPGSGQPDVLSR